MWHRLDIQDLENSSISETTCVHQPQKHQLTVARWTSWATLLISIVVVFGFWWHCHLSQVIHHLKLSFEITLSVASKFVGSMQLRTLVFYEYFGFYMLFNGLYKIWELLHRSTWCYSFVSVVAFIHFPKVCALRVGLFGRDWDVVVSCCFYSCALRVPWQWQRGWFGVGQALDCIRHLVQQLDAMGHLIFSEKEVNIRQSTEP